MDRSGIKRARLSYSHNLTYVCMWMFWAQQCPRCNHVGRRTFSKAQWPNTEGPPAFKQAILHAACCQPTTNSLQSARSALWSLSMATWRRATSPRPERWKSGPHVTAPHNTRPCPAFSPTAVSWTTSGDKRLPECFGLQAIYTDMRVIHSNSAHTGLCVHFASAVLLNQQRGKRIHMGTVTYILLIHIQLGVCHTETLQHPQTLTLRRTTTRQKF